MALTMITSEHIRAYFRGELQGEALTDFHQSLQNDLDLRRTVNAMQGMYEHSKNEQAWQELDSLSEFINDEAALNRGKQKLKTLLENIPPKPKIVPIYRRLRMYVAAAVLLLTLGFFWWYRPAETPAVVDYQPVSFESNYTPTATNELLAQYEKALAAHQSDDAQTLHEISDKLSAIYPYETEYVPRLRLMSAAMYVENQRYKKALQQLSDFAPPTDAMGEEIRLKALYYQAVSQYHLGEKQAAKDILQQLNREADKSFIKTYKIQKWLRKSKK